MWFSLDGCGPIFFYFKWRSRQIAESNPIVNWFDHKFNHRPTRTVLIHVWFGISAKTLQRLAAHLVAQQRCYIPTASRQGWSKRRREAHRNSQKSTPLAQEIAETILTWKTCVSAFFPWTGCTCSIMEHVHIPHGTRGAFVSTWHFGARSGWRILRYDSTR